MAIGSGLLIVHKWLEFTLTENYKQAYNQIYVDPEIRKLCVDKFPTKDSLDTWANQICAGYLINFSF